MPPSVLLAVCGGLAAAALMSPSAVAAEGDRPGERPPAYVGSGPGASAASAASAGAAGAAGAAVGGRTPGWAAALPTLAPHRPGASASPVSPAAPLPTVGPSGPDRGGVPAQATGEPAELPAGPESAPPAARADGGDGASPVPGSAVPARPPASDSPFGSPFASPSGTASGSPSEDPSALPRPRHSVLRPPPAARQPAVAPPAVGRSRGPAAAVRPAPAGSAGPVGAGQTMTGPADAEDGDGGEAEATGIGATAPPFSSVAAGTYLPLGMGMTMIGFGVALVGFRLRRR
ncbi:hypothetical protein [Peterkaempfera bronchialis]|uniref:hypothetical protein n=1 Tax=Peterkaempfera bronchialis TaxID=2126346 RepID=UPI003C2DC2B0